MSFLTDYLKFNECNEAHTNYHIWSALVALSATVGRRVWINYGHQVIYCQLYVVLVGPPGNRKSTAMYIAKDLLRQSGHTYFAAQLESREGLIKQMAGNEVAFTYGDSAKTYMPMTICVGELKDFLGVSMNNMINFTTAVWDSDYYDYKLRNKDDIIIVNPYLTILACDTPAWITSRLQDDVISGGFSRRTAFLYETDKARSIPIPVVTPDQFAAWKRCVEYCRKLQEVTGQVEFTPAGKEFFIKWYNKKETSTDLALQGYYDSKHILTLKIAILLGLTESFELKLTDHHIMAALELQAQMEVNLPLVFQGIGRNELTSVTNKITEVLAIHKSPMKEKDLRAVMWRDATGREFDEVILHLTRSDQITRYKQGDRTMVCLNKFLPSDVRQELERAALTVRGASPAIGQPSALETIPDDLTHLLRANQPPAPTASGQGIVEPPKLVASGGTSPGSTPAGK